MSRDALESIKKITLQSKNYPAILKEIHDPPKRTLYQRRNYRPR